MIHLSVTVGMNVTFVPTKTYLFSLDNQQKNHKYFLYYTYNITPLSENS